jgi:hypothetical protein
MIKLFLLQLRDIIVRNYFVSIYAAKVNNQIYFLNNYFLLLYLIKLLPFDVLKWFCNLANIQIIYKLDNIYNISNNKHMHIMPILLKFDVCQYDDKNNIINHTNILPDVKYYNGMIPLEFLLKNTHLETYNQLQIKYLHKGKMIDKIINIDNFNHALIYELFD